MWTTGHTSLTPTILTPVYESRRGAEHLRGGRAVEPGSAWATSLPPGGDSQGQRAGEGCADHSWPGAPAAAGLRWCGRRVRGSSSSVTVPTSPLTRTRAPSVIRRVATPVPSTAGMPYSLATIELNVTPDTSTISCTRTVRLTGARAANRAGEGITDRYHQRLGLTSSRNRTGEAQQLTDGCSAVTVAAAPRSTIGYQEAVGRFP
jgi:hypothetical protein